MNYLINNPFKNFYNNIQVYNNNKHLFINNINIYISNFINNSKMIIYNNNINKYFSNFINNSIYYFKYYSNIIILFAKNNILFIFNK
jgi:hypothetical protein